MQREESSFRRLQVTSPQFQNDFLYPEIGPQTYDFIDEAYQNVVVLFPAGYPRMFLTGLLQMNHFPADGPVPDLYGIRFHFYLLLLALCSALLAVKEALHCLEVGATTSIASVGHCELGCTDGRPRSISSHEKVNTDSRTRLYIFHFSSELSNCFDPESVELIIHIITKDKQGLPWFVCRASSFRCCCSSGD